MDEGEKEMSKATIEVSFLAGTDVVEAINEAKSLAKKLDVCYVSFNFNNTKFSVGRNADVDKLIAEFNHDRVYSAGSKTTIIGA
jgi:hypothetical protein